MRFTLRQLEYFVAAGEAGSIRLAAERVNISQPSVSAAISGLEREFGLQLFIRHHAQGLSPTAAGTRLLREARALLAHADELRAMAGTLSDRVAGPLAVGGLVTLAPLILPELCQRFHERHPDVRVSIVEGDHATLLAKLRRGEVASAITYDLQIPDDIAFVPLVALPPRLLLAAGDPLARRRRLRLADMAGRPFVLLDLPLSREYFLSLFMRENVTPTVAARSEHPEVIRSLVANGYGYTLVNVRPRTMVSIDGRPLVDIPLAGDYRAMHIGVASLGGARKTRTVQAFEAHCRESIGPHAIPGMVPPGGRPRAVRRTGE